MSNIMKRIQNLDGAKTFETTGVHSNIKPKNYQTLSVSTEGTYTVDEAIDKMGFGKFQLKLTAFVGLCWMADAMEIMILSILSPALHCEWQISTLQEALLTVLVFLGMMIGSAGWGKVSDIYGRKASILLCSFYTVFYGVLSAFAPNYVSLLILRTLVGIGIGGVPQAVTIYSEFLPTKFRFAIVFVQFFWSSGTFLIVLAALFIMPEYGWRYLVLTAALPCLIFSGSCLWMPESIRYHCACGDIEGAMKTLTRVARDNGQSLPTGRLVSSANDIGTPNKRGRIRDLFQPDWRITTSLLWFIWIAACFSYYGLVLMSTKLYATDCKEGGSREQNTTAVACNLDCKLLDRNDYVQLLWTSFAEFPGIILCLVLIQLIGRKKALALQMFIFAGFTLSLIKCFRTSVLTGLIFTARAGVTGAFQTLYVYTPEVYPTEVRAIGLGSCCAAARIGAIITPFVGQVMLEHSISLAVSIYGAVALIGAVCSLLLPIETKGRQLASNSSLSRKPSELNQP